MITSVCLSFHKISTKFLNGFKQNFTKGFPLPRFGLFVFEGTVTRRSGLSGDDPSPRLRFLRGVFLVNLMASIDNLT